MPKVKTFPHQSLRRCTYAFCMQAEQKNQPETNKNHKPPDHATATSQKIAGSNEVKSWLWMLIISVLASYPQQNAALQNMRDLQKYGNECPATNSQ